MNCNISNCQSGALFTNISRLVLRGSPAFTLFLLKKKNTGIEVMVSLINVLNYIKVMYLLGGILNTVI